MGIENFVPVQQEIHQWSDRRKLVETVLLPMMVFVHADPKERMAALTLSTVSRFMVLRGEGKPAVIPDEQMARFRYLADLQQSNVNGIKTHTYSHVFMVGFVKDLYRVSNKKGANLPPSVRAN